MISKASSYAIKALTYLTIQNATREFVPISEIAEELSIPYHFLKKVMAQLAQSGMLNSQRSAKGGVAIGMEPSKISLLDIIRYVDGQLLFPECILGLPGCGEEKPCPLHAAWSAERSRLRLMFSSTTLQDVAERVVSESVRLKP